MTKEEAVGVLQRNDRGAIDENDAEKIAKAFGTTLQELRLVPQPVKTLHRFNYQEKDKDKWVVSVYRLADRLCEYITGIKVYSDMNGQGSYASDITEKATAKLIEHSWLKN